MIKKNLFAGINKFVNIFNYIFCEYKINTKL